MKMKSNVTRFACICMYTCSFYRMPNLISTCTEFWNVFYLGSEPGSSYHTVAASASVAFACTASAPTDTTVALWVRREHNPIQMGGGGVVEFGRKIWEGENIGQKQNKGLIMYRSQVLGNKRKGKYNQLVGLSLTLTSQV